ncbi:MAG: hypothetical protein HYZ68_02470, partial [Chloroflexi bacterium]|nr:hypothetical protein [Chloroflexota bacterium]
MLGKPIFSLIGLLLIGALVGILLAALWYSGLFGFLLNPTEIASATDDLLESIHLCLGEGCGLLDFRLSREWIDLTFMLLTILTLLPFLVISL